MFKFEVLVGTEAHKQLLDKLTDLSAQDKEVHYEESEGSIEVKQGGVTHTITGIIARGQAET